MRRATRRFLLGLILVSGPALAGDKKVTICHYPPDEPSALHTITVSEKALPAHLAHGDSIGTCPTGCQLDPTVCNDGNLCTFDTCLADGTCSHAAVNCVDGNPCTLDLCDPDVGCLNPTNDGVSCDDGNACTDSDTCDDAVCVGRDIPGCCLTDPECNDGNLCTMDTCLDYSCTNVTVDCTVSGNLCIAGYCDPDTGECATAPVECGDGNVCTDDHCDPVIGCYSVPTTAPPQEAETSCNDGADNDCDGFVDGADPDCVVATPCWSQAEIDQLGVNNGYVKIYRHVVNNCDEMWYLEERIPNPNPPGPDLAMYTGAKYDSSTGQYFCWYRNSITAAPPVARDLFISASQYTASEQSIIDRAAALGWWPWETVSGVCP